MSIMSKAVFAIAAAVAMTGASAVSAQTATVSPTGAITVEGTLNQSLSGGQLLTQCHVVFQGTADANGFTLTSYTGTNLNNGPLACKESLVFPIRIDAVSPTQLNVQTLTIQTRYGNCSVNNLMLDWVNATNDTPSSVTFPVGTFIPPVCEFNGTLTVSPKTTIN